MKKGTTIGVDLGGTNVRAGLVRGSKIEKLSARKIRGHGTKEEVLDDLYATLDAVMAKGVRGIGIGVPSLVHRKSGTILDTTNIASWKKVPLRRLLEKRYKVPVRVENDANCFALGERLSGAGRDRENFVGIVLGTGLGSGIVANGRLVSGTDGGAGEFGLIPYRDGILENYCSGQFFRRYGREGAEVALAAAAGDAEAARLFGEFGMHLGFAIKVVLYALAPERIIFGGSVSAAWPHFRGSLEEALADFAYPSVLKALDFRLSKVKHGAILGAASLFDNES